MKRLLVPLCLLVALLFWWRWPHRSAPAPTDRPTTPTTAAQRGLTPIHVAKGLPAWFGQMDAPPRRIAGRVIADGAPVRARVTLTSVVTDAGVIAAQVIETSDGGFDFGDQVAAAYLVTASRDGFTPAMVNVDLRWVTARPSPDALEIELRPCQHTIAGTVHDASGGVIQGAEVAIESGWRLGPPTRTGADGSYRMCVPRDTFDLHFAAAGYGSLARQVEADGHLVEDARLTPEAVVSGRVVTAEDGAPIAAVLIEAGPRQWSSAERPARVSTQTDGDGRFVVSGLSPGVVALNATSPGRVMEPASYPLRTEPGQTSEEITLRMARAVTVHGVVKAGDDAVPGVRVRWQPFGSSTRDSAWTQTNGSFTLDALAPGPGVFEVSDHDVIAPEEWTARAGDDRAVEVEVAARASLTGSCVRKDAPVPGCAVQAWAQGGTGHSAVTNSDGRFELTGLGAGSYQVSAESERLGAFAEPQTITLADREQRENLVFDLTMAATVSGVVVDQTGAAVVGARVALTREDDDDGGSARSRGDGTFTVDRLAGGGRYRVSVTAAESRAPLPPVTGKTLPAIEIAGPDTAITGQRLAVVLERGMLAGIVVDADGAPAADVRITAEPMTGNRTPAFSGWLALPRTVTDADGRFELFCSGRAQFAIEAIAPGGAATTVTDLALDTRDIRVVLPPTGVIEGTVRGFTSPPLVTATKRRGASPSRASARATDGRFRLPGLPAGTYIVDAMAGLEQARASVEVVAGETAETALESHGVGRLEVHVTGFQDARPIVGAFCNVQSWLADPVQVVSSADPSTDSTGQLVMPAPAGPIHLSCRGPTPYGSAMKRVEVEPGRVLRIDLRLLEREEPEHPANFGFAAEVKNDLLVVTKVTAAPAAGNLVVGDVIVAIDHIGVDEVTPDGAKNLLLRPRGTSMRLEILRGDLPMTFELTSPS